MLGSLSTSRKKARSASGFELLITQCAPMSIGAPPFGTSVTLERWTQSLDSMTFHSSNVGRVTNTLERGLPRGISQVSIRHLAKREAVAPSSPCSAVATRVRDQPGTVSFRAYDGSPCLASAVERLLQSCQEKREGGTMSPAPNMPSADNPKNSTAGPGGEQAVCVPSLSGRRPLREVGAVECESRGCLSRSR